MWLLAALFGLLIVVAVLEYIHWSYTSMVDETVRHRRNMDLQVLENLADLLESMYDSTSNYGVPYNDFVRFAVAEHIKVARQVLLDRRGPPPKGIFAYLEGQKWPFDKSGKVTM